MAEKGKNLGLVKFWAFVVGLVLSLVMGIITPAEPITITVLMTLGIIIALRTSLKGLTILLLATIALIVVVNIFEPLKSIITGRIIANTLYYIATMVGTTAVIVAIKSVLGVCRLTE